MWQREVLQDLLQGHFLRLVSPITMSLFYQHHALTPRFFSIDGAARFDYFLLHSGIASSRNLSCLVPSYYLRTEQINPLNKVLALHCGDRVNQKPDASLASERFIHFTIAARAKNDIKYS